MIDISISHLLTTPSTNLPLQNLKTQQKYNPLLLLYSTIVTFCCALCEKLILQKWGSPAKGGQLTTLSGTRHRGPSII